MSMNSFTARSVTATMTTHSCLQDQCFYFNKADGIQLRITIENGWGGNSWWPSGSTFTAGARVQYLVGELRFHKPVAQPKKKKKKKLLDFFVFCH